MLMATASTHVAPLTPRPVRDVTARSVLLQLLLGWLTWIRRRLEGLGLVGLLLDGDLLVLQCLLEGRKQPAEHIAVVVPCLGRGDVGLVTRFGTYGTAESRLPGAY